MSFAYRWADRLVCSGVVERARRWTLALTSLFLIAGSGIASAASFVGSDLSDVKPEDRAVVAHQQPVQLLFEFQTKGAPNARATKYLKQTVVDTVKDSGLFSEVDDGPAPNGAILSIVINNVVEPKDLQAAEAKGVVTGATLFLAGSTVRDHYVSTIDYSSGPTAPHVTRTARHSVIVQLGLINSKPTDGVKAGGVKDAVFTMARQIVSNPLNAAAKDPNFQPSAPPPVEPSAAAPAPATPTPTDGPVPLQAPTNAAAPPASPAAPQ